MPYNIVNGFTGLPHNGPEELKHIVSAILGSTARVYDWGGKFATTVSANGRTATVKSGAMSIEGWLAVSSMDEQLPIDAGVAGQKRNDLIVARIRREGSIDIGTQRFALEVVKGASTTGTPTDPSIVAANADSMALYRIPIDGVTVKTPVRMFTLNSTINAMGDSLSRMYKPKSYDSGEVSTNASGVVHLNVTSSVAVLAVNGVKLDSGSWASVVLDYTIPAAYRPQVALFAKMNVDNSAGNTRQLVVGTDGRITVSNQGSSGAGGVGRASLTWGVA